MRAVFRSELLKQRSTQTALGLFSALTGLVLFAVLLHGLALPVRSLDSADEQLMVFGRGEVLAALFAGLLGAMSITGEIRHGTIRPTFLLTPRRARVIWAKVLVSTLIGAGFGFVAVALASAVGSAALEARGIDPRLSAGDYTLLVAGGAAAASLWAAIGVGVGALVRNQVPTLVGISAWLLFVEGVLAGDLVAGIDDVRRFAPGAAAEAMTGQEQGALLAPAAGLLVLGAYATAAALVGALATDRRDVA